LNSKTPSGGYHPYFNYATSSEDDELLIKRYLKTASEYKGKGIDVRSTGGHIVAPSSRRSGKSYEIIHDVAPAEIRSSLISWLIVGKPPARKDPDGNVKEASLNNYEYDLEPEQIKSILSKLPRKYLDKYSDWLIVTTVLKHHGLYDIWEEWRRQSTHYSQAKKASQ
jgi:hypothetical protein